MIEEKLKNVEVKDIMQLIVKEPTLIKKESPITEILDKIIKDPRSRHVYVVDNDNKLIGSVRLNYIIEYLFPSTLFFLNIASLQENNIDHSLSIFLKKKTVKDIMNSNPKFVYAETKLSDMIAIMTKENVNELPVLDNEMKVIGEVNILEIISYIRKQEVKEIK